MKKLVILSLVLLVSACSLSIPKTGKILFSVPSEFTQAASEDKAVLLSSTDTVRFWLLQGGAAVKIFSMDAIEIRPLPTREIILDELPANESTSVPPYQLVVVLGTRDEASGVFHPDVYGVSTEFRLLGGLEKTVTVTLKKTPYTTVSDDTKASFAVVANTPSDDLYVLTGQSLSLNSGEGMPLSLPEGTTANSVSTGHWFNTDDTGMVDEAWLNTTTGIYRQENDTWTAIMNSGDRTNVKVSGSAHLKFVETDPNENLAIFYLNGGLDIGFCLSLDGTERSTVPSTWTWYNGTVMLDDPKLANIKSFIGDIKGDIVLSYALRDNFILAVTPIGTVRVGNDLKDVVKAANDAGTAIDANWVINNVLKDGKYFLSVTARTILSVASAGSLSFAGTNKGIYYAAIDADGVPAGAFALVSGTGAKKVTTLNSVEFQGSVFTAAILSDGGIAILKDSALWKQKPTSTGFYPSYSGVPANPKSLAWQKQETSLSLVVKGDGIAMFPGIF